MIAALQTLGGTPTVTLQTTHHYNSGTAAAGCPRLRRRRAPAGCAAEGAQQ